MTSRREPIPSADLAQFITNLSFADLDDGLVRRAERCFVDTVGVTLAGAVESSTRKARIVAGTRSDEGEATVVGIDVRAPLSVATFISGTAAHALDFDDVSWAMDGHPSAPLVIPILGTAEVSDVTGEEALTAYVAGFETECYLAAPVSPSHYERGWHATATFGTFGAAAATAKVLDLSVEETRRALNVAASMPAGLKRNFGTMTKPMHVGQAVQSGVTAARLASNGFTADDRAIGGDRGFLDLYGGEEQPDFEAFSELGERWALEEAGVHVKKYPCCYFTHTSIAATVDLVTTHDISPADITDVQVVASGGTVDALPHDNPQTPLEAKFSMPYTVAYAAVNRQVGLTAFERDALTDPEVRSLLDAVSLRASDDLDYDDHAALVRITTRTDEYERLLSNPPGAHDNPLSDRELREKFTMCATRVLDESDAHDVLNRLDTLRSETSVASLTASI